MPAVSQERCKTLYFAGGARVCDPDISWSEYAWLNAQGAMRGEVYDCEDLQRRYAACLIAGVKPSTPAPPPISSDPAVYNDPSLPQKADDATRSRFEQWLTVTLPGYFSGSIDSEGNPVDDGELPGGIKKEWLLYGLLGIAAVALIAGGRRR